MTKNSNYQELLAIERDIYKQSQMSPAFTAFNAQKIKQFFSQNTTRLAVAKQNLDRIFNAHIWSDEPGTWRKISKEGEADAWDFKSKGDEEDFKLEYEEFVSRPCTINL